MSKVIKKEDAKNQLKSIQENGKYKNYREFKMMGEGSFLETMKEWFFSKNVREPEQKLTFSAINPDSLFTGEQKCLRATWLGHSSFIIEVDGLRLLLDPVLSNDVSPAPWLYSVGRFQKQTPRGVIK